MMYILGHVRLKVVTSITGGLELSAVDTTELVISSW